MASNNLTPIQQLVSNDVSLFETFLMYAVINDQHTWKLIFKDTINVNQNQKVSYLSFNPNFNDFTKPVDNTIYNIVRDIYLSVGEESEIKIDPHMIMSLAKSKLNRSDGILIPAEISAMQIRLREIGEISTPKEYDNGVKALVNEGWGYWLNLRRVRQLSVASYNNSMDADTLIDKIKSSTAAITAGTIDQISFKSAMVGDEDDSKERMSLGLPLANSVMRGGIKRQETLLIVAPSGGGKTVIACQIAGSMASEGTKVCYISTEQPAFELTPRIISCLASIPYDKITDGVDKAIYNSTLTKDELDRLDDVAKHIGDNLKFENWCDSGDNIASKLEKTIEMYLGTSGLDVVVLDWLGGGLAVDEAKFDWLRHYYKSTAVYLKKLARKYNIAIITMAQASEKQCDGVVRVSSNEISECKQLHESFVWGLGISALKEPAKKLINNTSENVKRRQYFNWFKTRKSKAVTYPVEREFEFQRFIEKSNTFDAEPKPQQVKLNNNQINEESKGLYKIV